MPHNIFTNASKSVREHNFAGDVSFDRMILYGCDSIWMWFGNLSWIWQISLLSQPLRVTQLSASFIHAFSFSSLSLIFLSQCGDLTKVIIANSLTSSQLFVFLLNVWSLELFDKSNGNNDQPQERKNLCLKENFLCLEKSYTNMIRVTNFPCNLTKHISVEDYSNVKAILRRSEAKMFTEVCGWLGVGGGDKLGF